MIWRHSAKQGRATLTLKCIWLAVALLPAGPVHEARAQANSVDREIVAMPGRDVRVGVFTSIKADCTSGPLPAIRLAAAPAHGAVTVKRGTLKATNFKQCLATEVPAFVVFYRAAQDYNGADAFDLAISFGAGRTQLQHIRVNVTSNPNGARGI